MRQAAAFVRSWDDLRLKITKDFSAWDDTGEALRKPKWSPGPFTRAL